MGDLPTSIPTGGPPITFYHDLTNVPRDGGPGPEYARRIRSGLDLNSAKSHLHLPTSHWKITHSYYVTPFPKTEYHKHLKEDDVVFCQRVPMDSTKPQKSLIALSFYCMNDVLRKGWESARRAIEPRMRDYREGRTNGAEDEVLRYMTMPEAKWHPLVAQGSTKPTKAAGNLMLQWLFKEGIVTRYNILGVVLVAPQIDYGPSEVPRRGSRMQTTFNLLGVSIVANIWGSKATQGAYLWIVLKAVPDRLTTVDANMAYVTYASMEKTVPAAFLEYRGIAGFIETGHAWLFGRVDRVLGPPPSDEQVELMLGLRGTIEQSRDACSGASKLKILLASSDRCY